MAKRKSDIAPSATIAGTATAVDRWIDQIDQNLSDVQAKCTKAFEEGQTRGFDTQLQASQALNIGYDVLADWSPKIARTDGDKVEDAIRDQHNRTEPQSCYARLVQVKSDLGMLSNACEEKTISNLRTKYRILPKRKADMTPAQGRDVLQAARVSALAAKDQTRVKTLDTHLKAIGNEDAVADLAKDATGVEKAYSRWRLRLYLHLCAPMMKAGGVPTSAYETVCGVASRAHKLCDKLSPQERTAKRVKAYVEEYLSDWIATEYGTKEKDKRTNHEVGMAAALSIFPAARRARKADVITQETYENIVGWLTNGSGLEDPEVTRSNEALAKREAKKLAKDAAAKAKGVATPTSTKGKKKSQTKPKNAPKRARQTAPAAPPSQVPVATDASDNEDVLADMAS